MEVVDNLALSFKEGEWGVGCSFPFPQNLMAILGEEQVIERQAPSTQ